MKIGDYEVTILSKESAKVGCTTVSRDDVRRIAEAMDTYNPPFKVGDFVRVSRDGFDRHAQVGKIVSFGDPSIGTVAVEFPLMGEDSGATHNGKRVVARGHGSWFDIKYLELYDLTGEE